MRAMVISGGGSKGSFAGGVAQYLMKEKGYDYDLFLGTSTGSLLISHLALQKIEKIKEVYTSVNQKSIFSNCPFNVQKKRGVETIGINYLNVVKNFYRGSKTFGESHNLLKLIIKEISIPYCIASSGSYEKMQTTLGKTELLHYFNGNIYSTSGVARGKPFPDIYLHAANEMGVFDVSKCLVIEDSPLGVEGGVSAGMTVFGYSELMNETKLIEAGAHQTFDNMRNLINEIQSFERKSL